MKNILKELRSFLLLWSTQTLSSLGTAMTEYALTLWVYQQQGTASSVTMLTLCIFLPTILFRFLAGAVADKWDKKRILLITDAFAACGTLAVLVLYLTGTLRIGHLYVINVLLSFANAFQVPASFAATSLIVPKAHYTRIGGLQGFSGAAVSILAPSLGAALLVIGGVPLVLTIDLISFAIALTVLLLFIRIPKPESTEDTAKEPFLETCMEGLRYVYSDKAILHLTLFLTVVNFLAKVGNDGLLAPFVLARTGSDQTALGFLQSALSLGILSGSLLVTVLKPAKRKSRVTFLMYAFVFMGNIVLSLTASVWVWCAAQFFCYGAAAIMNANLTAMLRERIPQQLHGRVFSAKDTLQNCAIPLGLFLGGIWADQVFEPFMAATSPLQSALSAWFGTGSGAGIALLFFLVGVLGSGFCLAQLLRPVFRSLDD